MKNQRFGFFMRLKDKSKQSSVILETRKEYRTSYNPQSKQFDGDSFIHLRMNAKKRHSNCDMLLGSSKRNRKSKCVRQFFSRKRYNRKTSKQNAMSGQNGTLSNYVANPRFLQIKNIVETEQSSTVRNESAPVSWVNISRIIESHQTSTNMNNSKNQNLTNANHFHSKNPKMPNKLKIKLKNKHQRSEKLDIGERKVDKCQLKQGFQRNSIHTGLLYYTIKVNKIFSKFKMSNESEIISKSRTNRRRSQRDKRKWSKIDNHNRMISKERVLKGANFGNNMGRDSKRRSRKRYLRVSYKKNIEPRSQQNSIENSLENPKIDSLGLNISKGNKDLRPIHKNASIIKDRRNENSKICINNRKNDNFRFSTHKKQNLKTSVISILKIRTEIKQSPKVIQHLAEIRHVVSQIKPFLSISRINVKNATNFEIKRVLGVGDIFVIKLMKRKIDGKHFAGKFVNFRFLKYKGVIKTIQVIDFKFFLNHKLKIIQIF